jgi:alcohol dehydrogenase
VKAVLFEKHGNVDVLQFREWPDPIAAADEVVLRVRATGLNYLDVFVRRGMPGVTTPLPFISGGDIAGEIETLGADVAGWRVGERVVVNPKTAKGLLGEEVQGGLAERVCVPANSLLRLPDTINYDLGAAIPINFGTALRMLVTIGRLTAGEMILILGASGGVGTACVQVAKTLGAKVIAAAGSDEKTETLKGMGADHVINYTRENFSQRAWELTGRRGVNVVVNFTGGDTFVPSLRALAQHGRLLVCGATAGYDPLIDLRYVWRRELQILGSTGYLQTDIAKAIEMVAAGTLKPIISHRFTLAETAEAERLLENRNFFGKIVVLP